MARALVNLLVLLIAAVAGLLVLEGLLRLLHAYPSFSSPDPVIGFRLAPGARYHWTEEGSSEGRINAAGWRDHDYALAKPAGTTRILFCGDSFVEALQVPLDSTFHKRLERALNARAAGRRRYEVVALGRSGMGTTEEYLTYKRWGAAYDPDVVAVLFVLNDFSDNTRSVDPQTAIRPYLVESDDSLALDTTFLHSPAYRARVRLEPWKRRSSLVSLAAKTWNDIRLRRALADLGRTTVHDDVSFEFDRRLPADSIEAFRVTGEILGRFARDVHRDGRRFVVFVAGSAKQEDPGELALARRNPAFDAGKPQRFLERAGRRYGFDVVPLTPAFRSALRRSRRPLWYRTRTGFGHWNNAGHVVAGAAMERYFLRHLR